MAEGPIIHIVDDDQAVRDSLAFLFQSAGHGVATYSDAETLLAASPAIQFGCIITDVRMPGMTGIELIKDIRSRGSHVPIIVITGHGDVPLAVEAMRAGACDFIEKPFNDDAILKAVQSALRNEAAEDERAQERAEIRERLATLSARERQVMDAVVAGKANKIVAFDLGISPRTVEVYRANVMTKMHAHTLSDLVRMALLVGHD